MHSFGDISVMVRPEKSAGQFVVVGVAGSGLNNAIKYIIQLAKNAGFNEIRFHNKTGITPSLINAKLIEKKRGEYIYKLEI